MSLTSAFIGKTGVDAEWRFFATAHGKGPCEGVGGTVKRLATKASLQRPYNNQIHTPHQLFLWADEDIKNVFFEFSTQEDHIKTEDFLKERFNNSVTIKGTQKLHCFIPTKSSTSIVHTKVFSNDPQYKAEVVNKSQEKLRLPEITGYITIVYDKQWWLAYVLDKNEEDDEVKLSYLHPAGPSQSFSFLMKLDILWLPSNEVLCKVQITTPTGSTYNIVNDGDMNTVKAFAAYNGVIN